MRGGKGAESHRFSQDLAAHIDLQTLAIGSLLAAAIAAALVQFWPAKYLAQAQILLDNPSESSSLMDLSQLSDIAPGGILSGLSRRENGYAYVEIARSRSVLFHLLSEPDSSSRYKTYLGRFSPNLGSEQYRREAAVKRLRRATTVKYDSKAGIIRLSVRDREARVAANLANLLVGELQRFNMDVRRTRARDAVRFVGERLEEAKVTLSAAEEKLVAFREANARIGNAPALVVQGARLERNVRFAEDMYALLARQLELARIQEKRESPVFSMIDHAVPPARPERFSPLTAAGLAGLTAAVAASMMRIGLRISRGESPRDDASSDG